MTRPPRPPPPRSRLAHLLRRVGAELRRVPLDPDLPRRVERAIRADLARRRPRPPLPAWAAVAAVVLLALLAGASTHDRRQASLLAPAETHAPPPPPRPKTQPPHHAEPEPPHPEHP